MRIWPWVAGFLGASAATLLYGALVEAYRLSVERTRLRLPGWPSHLNGYTIAHLSDLHVRDAGSLALAREAMAAAVAAAPDAIVLTGDYVEHWRDESAGWLLEALEPLLEFDGTKIAIPGNHDYYEGDAGFLAPIFEAVGVVYLRNTSVVLDGIAWVGVDSANEMMGNPYLPFLALAEEEGSASPVPPKVVLWHEPDVVDWLPSGAALMLSGHSHGGQFTFPWGWTPMYTKNGRLYPRGFYPEASTPLFVSRGVGVTGPPSRLCCLPEVAILELVSAAE